jgi:hypothetical protein
MRLILLLFLMHLTQWGMSQLKTIPSDTQWLHRSFYPNHHWSAYSYLLFSTGNGQAVCFNPDGKIMFKSEISRNHGHHSVVFTHHQNKVVSKVEESQAPDAGIQWYRSEYYFDDRGIKTGESHDSYDERPGLRVLKIFEPIEK